MKSIWVAQNFYSLYLKFQPEMIFCWMFQVVMATMIITTHYQWKYHLHLQYSNPLIKKEKPSSNLQLVNLGDNFLKKNWGRNLFRYFFCIWFIEGFYFISFFQDNLSLTLFLHTLKPPTQLSFWGNRVFNISSSKDFISNENSKDTPLKTILLKQLSKYKRILDLFLVFLL